MKSFFLSAFLLLAFAASGQVLLSDANPPASDTTHGAAILLYKIKYPEAVPLDSVAAIFNKGPHVTMEILPAYMVRTEDRLRLFRADNHTEIPLRDLVHFTPDEK